MRVQPNVIRILDLCILNYKADPDSAPTTPPLLAVEIISKDDSYTDVLTKLREYHQWGVRNIWLIIRGWGNSPSMEPLDYFNWTNLPCRSSASPRTCKRYYRR